MPINDQSRTARGPNTPVLNEDFKDPSGRWGGESVRDAKKMEYDRFGEPVDRSSGQGLTDADDMRAEFPYGTPFGGYRF